MANPPITIGPFTNVPAPGSPIASAWAQTISQFLVDNLFLPNVMGGAGDAYGKLRVEAGYVTLVTDAAGNALLNYGGPSTFAGNPFVFITNARGDIGVLPTVITTTPSTASVRLRRIDTGGPIVSEGVAVFWLAIGRRA